MIFFTCCMKCGLARRIGTLVRMLMRSNGRMREGTRMVRSSQSVGSSPSSPTVFWTAATASDHVSSVLPSTCVLRVARPVRVTSESLNPRRTSSITTIRSGSSVGLLPPSTRADYTSFMLSLGEADPLWRASLKLLTDVMTRSCPRASDS